MEPSFLVSCCPRSSFLIPLEISFRVRIDKWSSEQHVSSHRSLGGGLKTKERQLIRTCIVHNTAQDVPVAPSRYSLSRRLLINVKNDISQNMDMTMDETFGSGRDLVLEQVRVRLGVGEPGTVNLRNQDLRTLILCSEIMDSLPL